MDRPDFGRQRLNLGPKQFGARTFCTLHFELWLVSYAFVFMHMPFSVLLVLAYSSVM
jgi:hypothetical protein